MTALPEHDDHLADAVALTEIAGTGDEAAARALLRHMNATAVAVRLARLLSEVVSENGQGRVVPPEFFRDFALGSRR